jgi:hypothetical protein
MPNTRQGLASIVRQIAAAAAVVIGALQSSGTLNGKFGYALIIAGAFILGVEHYVGDVSTGTTTAKPPVALRPTKETTTPEPPKDPGPLG